MAKRSLRRVRPLVLAGALAVGLIAVPHLAAAAPGGGAKAAPTVASVEKQLGQLALKNAQLVEKYNQARIVAAHRKAQAAVATKAAAKARAALASADAELSRTLTVQYESSGMSGAGALLSSSSGEAYLDQLDTLNMLSAHTAQVVQQMAMSKRSADRAVADARRLLAAAQADVRQVQATKTQVQKQIAKYKRTLNLLTAAQRSRYLHAANPAVSNSVLIKLSSNPGGSAKGRIAVQFALAQVGKPYVWGAAGPGSYDCSGLTMASWAHAGVQLPHSAAEQYNYGTHVPLSDLRPGDLIFMYSPIGHVTIYIGGGMMVSAPQSGEDVMVIPVSSFGGQIVGATHIA